MQSVEYYNHPYISNSELSRIKRATMAPNEEVEYTAALRRGNLLDAYVTWFSISPAMYYSLRPSAAEHDQVLKLYNALMANQLYKSLDISMDKQVAKFRASTPFHYNGVDFTLDTKCLFDFFQKGITGSMMGLTIGNILPYGGDLKRTSARTESQFMLDCERFDYDRSRAWYMHTAGTDKDFIIAVNEHGNVFMKTIKRGDSFHRDGVEKFSALAFKKWALAA